MSHVHSTLPATQVNWEQIVITATSIYVAVSAALLWTVRHLKHWLGDFIDRRIVSSTEIVKLASSIEHMSSSVAKLASQVAILEHHRQQEQKGRSS